MPGQQKKHILSFHESEKTKPKEGTQVTKKVPLKGLPAIVFIDRYGYIRLFSDNLRGIDADSVRKQVESALKRIP